MREAKIMIYVQHKHTKWGDSIHFYCEGTHWKRMHTLRTTAETFPWWQGEATIDVDALAKSDRMEFKMAVWRDGQEMWESFEGNRSMYIGSANYVVVRFGVKETWTCKVCQTLLDGVPVMCDLEHPMHAECFELYVNTELQSKRTAYSCMTCLKPLPDHAWQPLVCPSIVQRYQRVCAENAGGTVVRCPMGNCDFEVVYAQGDFSLPDNEQCPKCGVVWCTRCSRYGTLVDGECVVCAKGLKDVADLVYDALDDATGSKCPKCANRGQKAPSECTHITCDCGEVFCYCCGLPGADVDTSDEYAGTDLDRLYGHNDDYYCNQSRCPMWLVNYTDIYTSWPDDVDEAQEKFHSMKASNKLREAKAKVPQAQWDSFLDANDHVKDLVEKYLTETFVTCN